MRHSEKGNNFLAINLCALSAWRPLNRILIRPGFLKWQRFVKFQVSILLLGYLRQVYVYKLTYSIIKSIRLRAFEASN